MFVAVPTGLFPASHIAAVIKDVLEPSAIMLVGFAVFIIFVCDGVVVTFTVPSLKPVAVEVTVAAPTVAVDCKLTVASPETAAFVVVASNVP